MDEGHEGNGRRARPSEKAARRVDIHRVNDFVLGHVGQISYRPVAKNDDAAVGDLDFSRVDEYPPSLQPLVPFSEWLAPTRTSLVLPHSTTFQRTKSQKNWLLKTHAEAFLGNLDLPRLTSEETRARSSGGQETETGSLLAIGEILDLRNTKSSRTATCPVIALAAGEAGHILQLSAIHPETWRWGEVSLAVGASQTRFQGLWCSDGSSILKIEFATKVKQYDTIRWLIAQKGTSTTIIEPELRAKPLVGTALMAGLDGGGALDHIVMKPVATLTTNLLGGESQSDFSVNLGSNDVAPQLAIIDKSGNWFVWYIEREGHGRSRTTKAILMRKGSWAFPSSAKSDLDYMGMTYRVLWTSRFRRFDEWDRDRSPSTSSDPLPGSLQAAYLADYDAPRPKYDGLLMCNHTQLQVLDVGGERLPSRLDFARRDGMDSILDAQAFCGSSSHVFVLTTDKLYLLDVSLVEGLEAKSPHILASCRHFRTDGRQTLKVSITKLRSAHGEVSTLVAIHSTQSFRVDLFWFIITLRDGTARFHRQVVNFPGLSTATMGGPQGIESLAAVPLHLAPSKGKERRKPETEIDRDAQVADAQLYQLFALTADLSLSSSIVALTWGIRKNLTRPVKVDDLSWTDERRAKFLRRKWLRDTEQAFIVPDKAELAKPSSVAHLPRQADKHDTIQLRFYLLKLVQEINRAYAGESAEGAVNLTGTEHFNPIQEALKSLEEDEHVSLKPLLSFSDLWQPFDLSTLDDEWDFHMRRLNRSQHAQVFACGTYGANHSVMDLFEKLSVNWSAALLADSLKANQWRYMELALERMASEVFMSEKGIYMVPRSTLDLASDSVLQDRTQIQGDDDLHGLPSSQPRLSQALLTPSATPSSSRATSEAVDSTTNIQEEDEASGLEDPAVARLRMYLPSIKFTPPPKSGPSRVISLWPEQRNMDPSEYQYKPPGQGPDEEAEARKRRHERREERHRRRAEKMAQLGVKLDGVGESRSQPYSSKMVRSSPPPLPSQDIGSSQHHAPSQGFGGFGFGRQQSSSQNFSPGFGFSQIMSQPVPGEFGGRPRLKKGMAKVKTSNPGFK